MKPARSQAPSRLAKKAPMGDWMRELQPEQKALAQRWIKEAGPAAFQEIVRAYVDAGRLYGRTSLRNQRMPLLQAMAQMMVANPRLKTGGAANKVAQEAVSSGRVAVGLDTLRQWLRITFKELGEELIAEARRRAAHSSSRSPRGDPPITDFTALAREQAQAFAYSPTQLHSVFGTLSSATLTNPAAMNWLRQEDARRQSLEGLAEKLGYPSVDALALAIGPVTPSDT